MYIIFHRERERKTLLLMSVCVCACVGAVWSWLTLLIVLISVKNLENAKVVKKDGHAIKTQRSVKSFLSLSLSLITCSMLHSLKRALALALSFALFYYCVLSMHQFVNLWFMSITKATHFLGTSRDCIK